MKKLYFLGIFIFILSSAYSQDPSFVNPNQSLLNTNPSFAGSNGSLRDQFVYRNMWPNLSGNTVSYYNSLDTYVKKLHGGVAISGMTANEAHGEYINSQLNLVYAPIFECKASGLKIIPSIQVSYLRREFDFSKVTFGSLPYSQWGYTSPSGSKSGLDFSSGLLINYKNLYVGGTIFHINQPDMGTDGVSILPRRISFNASYNLPLNEKTLLNFSAVYNNQQTYNSIQLAANAVFLKHVIVGFGYISGSSVFMNLGYRNNYFYISGGYDFVSSELAGNTVGSWQISMGLSLRKKTVGQVPANFERW